MLHCFDQTLTINTSQSTAAAEWIKPVATDNSGESPTVTCDHDFQTAFKIGHTVKVCTALDAYGNGAVCTFTISIIGKVEICIHTSL